MFNLLTLFCFHSIFVKLPSDYIIVAKEYFGPLMKFSEYSPELLEIFRCIETGRSKLRESPVEI